MQSELESSTDQLSALENALQAAVISEDRLNKDLQTAISELEAAKALLDAKQQVRITLL